MKIKCAVKHSSGVMVEYWELLTVFYESEARSVHTLRGWVNEEEKVAGASPLWDFQFSLPAGTAPDLVQGVEAFSFAGLKLQPGFENAEKL